MPNELLLTSYPKYKTPELGSLMESTIQPYYDNMRSTKGIGSLHRAYQLASIQSCLVKSRYGDGIPFGVLIKKNADNSIDYLDEECSEEDIYGITISYEMPMYSEEGIPGVQNNYITNVAKFVSYCAFYVYCSEHLDLDSEFGVVVKSNSPDYLLGSVHNTNGSSAEDDVYILPITSKKFSLIEMVSEKNSVSIVFMEFNNNIIDSKASLSISMPESDYETIVGSPSYKNVSHLIGGMMTSSNGASYYIPSALTVDRETGVVSKSRLMPYSTLRMTPTLLKPSVCFMLDYVKLIFGGALGLSSASSVLDVKGYGNYWTQQALSLEDSESKYGISNTEHFTSNRGILYTQTDLQEKDPTKMQSIVYAIGGQIISKDFTTILPIVDSHKLDVTQKNSNWKQFTALNIKDENIDASNICLIQPEQYFVEGYAAGCKVSGKYRSLINFYTENRDSVGELLSREILPRNDEAKNILKYLSLGCGEVVEQGSDKVLYFMTSGIYTDVSNVKRNFAILKLNLLSERLEVILGDKIQDLIPGKEFVMNGASCVRGIGNASNLLYFYGSSYISNGLAANIMLILDTSNDKWIIRRVNSDITPALYSSTASNPANYEGFLNYFPLTGNISFLNNSLILGGLIIPSGDEYIVSENINLF